MCVSVYIYIYIHVYMNDKITSMLCLSPWNDILLYAFMAMKTTTFDNLLRKS